MRGVARLKRYYHGVLDFTFPKAVILMYHRVAVLPGYTRPLNVSPDHFRQQMSLLKKSTHPEIVKRPAATPCAS